MSTATRMEELRAIGLERKRERRQIRAEVHSGERSLSDLLRDPPECLTLGKAKPLLVEILNWSSSMRTGPKRSEKLLAELHLSPWLTLDGLSPTRREQLARRVEGL